MELSERDCHRLKAVLRDTAVKCIRESAWRTSFSSSRARVTHVTCFEWRILVWQGFSIRVEPRSLTSSLGYGYVSETEFFVWLQSAAEIFFYINEGDWTSWV